MQKGKNPVEKGKGVGYNEFAPSVVNSCDGRGKFLWRTCEYLVAAVKR